jgi:Glycosyl hydrolase catalytic core
MHRAGIAHARFNLNWSIIESNRGTFSWGSSDREIARLARSGVKAAPILLGTPGWLAHEPLAPPLRTGKARRAWRHFLHAAVRRYGPGGSFWAARPHLRRLPIRTWQIWNEPNYPASWKPRPSPHEYARFLKISKRTIRRVDRHAVIVLGALGPGHSGAGKYKATEFLRRLYRLGAKRDFDVAAVNSYAANARGDETKIAQLARVVRSHDRGASVWVTEVGWSSSRDPRHVWAAGSEHRQAKLMRQTFRWLVGHAHRLRATQVFWFDWRDMDNPITGQPGYDFGLRRANDAAKPAWRVFKRFAKR